MSRDRERVTYFVVPTSNYLAPAFLTVHPHLDNTPCIVKSLKWLVNTLIFIDPRQD